MTTQPTPPAVLAELERLDKEGTRGPFKLHTETAACYLSIESENGRIIGDSVSACLTDAQDKINGQRTVLLLNHAASLIADARAYAKLLDEIEKLAANWDVEAGSDQPSITDFNDGKRIAFNACAVQLRRLGATP